MANPKSETRSFETKEKNGSNLQSRCVESKHVPLQHSCGAFLTCWRTAEQVNTFPHRVHLMFVLPEDFFTCCVLHNYRCVRTCNKTIVPCVRHRGLKFMFISGNHGLEIVFVLFVVFHFPFFCFSHAFPCFNVLAIFPRFASRNFPANCQRDFFLKPFSFWLSLA